MPTQISGVPAPVVPFVYLGLFCNLLVIAISYRLSRVCHPVTDRAFEKRSGIDNAHELHAVRRERVNAQQGLMLSVAVRVRQAGVLCESNYFQPSTTHAKQSYAPFLHKHEIG